MEDVARLAVMEQHVGDQKLFSQILFKFLEKCRLILEKPDDYSLRTVECSSLNKWLKNDAFAGYLRYLGFEILPTKIVYPELLDVEKLRSAEEAIVRKLQVMGYSEMDTFRWYSSYKSLPPQKLEPVHVLKTDNQFLLTIQSLFNEVLKYEEEELRVLTAELVPIGQLAVRAMDRMRDHQQRIKTGKSSGPDLCYDVALLYELVSWFKESFFSWVDKPPCELCGGDTVFVGSEIRTVRVELYKCKSCPGTAQFFRHKDCRKLLRARRGRCGEWADAFALVCLSLGYETRYVYDTTDHVWCEVFDIDSRRWLHVDPCEGAVDTPLMYEHGWGKKLEYVIAVACDHVQDVTWRYSSNHAALLSRRRHCSESDLIASLLTLREARQRRVSDARRAALAKATALELAELMVERKPSDYEAQGRLSGSKEWRTQRGEIGRKSHTFQFDQPAVYAVSYCTAIDKYTVTKDNVEQETIDKWFDGAYAVENVFRKEEKDWKMVYLAREEGADNGVISWRFAAATGFRFSSIALNTSSALYEDGNVEWTLQFDEETPIVVEKDVVHLDRRFACARVTARLRGGRGREAWQHAQLFRQPTNATNSVLRFQMRLEENE